MGNVYKILVRKHEMKR